MKSLLLALSLSSILLVGCARQSQTAGDIASRAKSDKPTSSAEQLVVFDSVAEPKKVSLDQTAQAETIATDRKILKNADITMEVGSPSEVQRKVSMIAANRGGFIVSSESKQ